MDIDRVAAAPTPQFHQRPADSDNQARAPPATLGGTARSTSSGPSASASSASSGSATPPQQQQLQQQQHHNHNHHHRFPSSASDFSSSLSALSLPFPSPSPFIAPFMTPHSRSMSHADVRQNKRLSLQFPVSPATATANASPAFTPRLRPQSWVAAPASANTPVATPDPAPTPTESNILAVLAAQERYVLELKEELAKAEVDLKTLKNVWAVHEGNKHKNESRKHAQPSPLNTTLANTGSVQDEDTGSSAWMQKEMERRKMFLNNSKAPQRKVFSGSRHLRALSLLSPDKAFPPSFPQPLDLMDSPEDASQRPKPLIRSATTPSTSSNVAATVAGERMDPTGLSNIQRDALLRTGKQMATDFKDGLLTFFEDIRQATVGDEAASGLDSPAARNARKPSDPRPALGRVASSKKAASAKSSDVGEDFWSENGVGSTTTATTTTTSNKTQVAKNTRTPQKPSADKTAEEFEDWDSWDTPNDGKYATQTETTVSSDESDEPASPTTSGHNSSRTSTRYHSKRHDSKASSLTAPSSAGFSEDAALRDPNRNSIPWPDLVKLSPGNIKRTASHLMKEWEKNLTPPPESRAAGHSSGDFIGRSASPVNASDP